MFPISQPDQVLPAHRYIVASNQKVLIVAPIHASTPPEAHMEADRIAGRIQEEYPRASVLITKEKPSREFMALDLRSMFTCDHPEEYFPKRSIHA
jgi:hypothetical protein